MGNGTAGLWVIPVRGEFQYPMGNGTFSAEVHRHTRISFNTLWEMEPRARNLLALGKKFQYPMGNGTQRKQYFHIKSTVGFNTLWEMEPR